MIAHNPVMQSLETLETDPNAQIEGPGPRASLESLFNSDLSDIWRALPDCESHVIATSVAGIRFTTTPAEDGLTRLGVRLIWGEGTSDEPHEAMFSVNLPSVERGGRGM